MQEFVDRKLLDKARQLFAEERFSEAAPLYRDILRRIPQHVESLHRLAVIALRSGMAAHAIRLLREALRAGHESAEILNDLGAAFLKTGDTGNAQRCFERAMAQFPSSPLGFVSLAFLESGRGEFARAEQLYLNAIDIASDDLEAPLNLATFYRDWGLLDRSVELFSDLLRRDPHDLEIRNRRSHALLQQKKWNEGWGDYEFRLFNDKSPRFHVPRVPRWIGESLSGKHLLVVPEQGIGDEVQFASCYRDAIDQAAYCTIVCSPRLESIFARSFPDASFIPLQDEHSALWLDQTSELFDYYVSAGSLPKYFRQSDADFSGSPYLCVPPNWLSHGVNPSAAEPRGLRIGVSWFGGSLVEQMARRAIPFDIFKRIFEVPGIEFINLQHGCCDEATAKGELAAFRNLWTPTNIDPYQHLDPWLALIASLDLLVSVDNSNVHFAGAMGVPTSLLLSENPDWRWPNGEERSLWYQSVSFIRKNRERGWHGLISDVVKRLQTVANTRRPLSVA